MSGPAYHARTHLPGGTDPLRGLLPGVTDYAAAIISHPCAQHYWPCDETTGDLQDRIGGWHLERAAPHDVDGTSYPIYSGEGVANAANDPYDSDDLGRFQYVLESGDERDYWLNGASRTTELWLYLTSDALGGYALLNYASTHGGFAFARTGAGFVYEEGTGGATPAVDPDPFPTGVWQHVAAVTDAGIVSLYRGGVLVATGTDATATGGLITLLNRGDLASPWYGAVRHVAFYDCALTPAELQNHILLDATDTGAGEGWVLGLDENGDPVWESVEPPTINGEEQPNSLIHISGPLPPREPDIVEDWMEDQPFCWDGGAFTVQPKVWTTIPFTQVLMERQSNASGLTEWAELDWDDPAAAGWVNPSDPRAVRIVHDFVLLNDLGDVVDDFLGTWSIGLELEYPAVQLDSSHRALRVFETTRQKTVVMCETTRRDATSWAGSDVYRDADEFPGDEPNIETFSSGNASGELTLPPNFSFMPSAFSDGVYVPGYDNFPNGLKAGMRCVAQVWHDATMPLTFNCGADVGDTFKPHFMLAVNGYRDWGPPWSEWPLAP